MAPLTGAIEYTSVEPKFTGEFPVIAPGALEPVVNVIAKILAALVPQALVAVTLILPDAALPKSTVMEFVPVPDVMAAPAGTVQL